MDCWEHFVEDNENQQPTHVFDLVTYSRTTDKTATLSYKQALSIYQKHSMDNNKK